MNLDEGIYAIGIFNRGSITTRISYLIMDYFLKKLIKPLVHLSEFSKLYFFVNNILV